MPPSGSVSPAQPGVEGREELRAGTVQQEQQGAVLGGGCSSAGSAAALRQSVATATVP